MKNLKYILTFFAILFVSTLFAQQAELRGIWMTPRNGSGFWTKAEIARAMDSVANNNFNVVYFNAWSRGWPLWRSDYFYSHTGYYTDPAAGNRDILQEAIAEAHCRGLEIEAWCEYGFVAWWNGNSLPGYPKGPLLALHPDWIAKKRDGREEFESGHVGVFYWMSHNHPTPHLRKQLVQLTSTTTTAAHRAIYFGQQRSHSLSPAMWLMRSIEDSSSSCLLG